MIRRAMFSVLLVSGTLPLLAAEPWKVGVDANVTVTQGYYSTSWTGSEKSSVAWTTKLNTTFDRQMAKKFLWKNTLKLAYGQTWAPGERPKKSTDLIDLETAGRFTLGGIVDPYIGARLITSFYDNRNDSLIRALNPLDITESVGASREFVKSKTVTLSSRLAFAVNQKIDRDRPVAGSSDLKTVTSNNGGFESVTDLKVSAREGMLTYASNLKVFEALVSSIDDAPMAVLVNDSVPLWRYPDINWDNTVTLNVTKYIMVNLNAQLLYDREVEIDARFKEVLSLGLTWKFQN